MSEIAVRVDQTVQEWGNGLAVRLTAPVARAANMVRGTTVAVEVVDEGVLLRVIGKPKRTLEQRLKAFDPAKHSGETDTGGVVGAEVI